MRRHTSIWFFYFVAAALGFSFSGVLLLLAWDNAVETENRAFAFESLSVDDTARMGLRAAHEAIEAIAGFLGASSDDIGVASFDRLSRELMRRNEFVTAIAWYRRDPDQANDFVLRQRRVQGDVAPPAVLSAQSELPYASDLRSALENEAVTPVVFPLNGADASGYWLARPVPRATASRSIAAIAAARASGIARTELASRRHTVSPPASARSTPCGTTACPPLTKGA